MHYLLKSNAIFDTITKTTKSGYLEIKDGWIEDFHKECPNTDLPCLDYSQQCILPSFIDAHVHYYISCLVHTKKLDMVGGTSIQEVCEQAAQLPVYKGWKIGIGWYASEFGQQIYPDRFELDQHVKDIPTLLISGDAHTIWLNTKAMEELGIDEESIPSHITGERLKKEGVLSGVFLEAIAIYYLAKILEMFQVEFHHAHNEYMKELNRMGITAVGDVALTGESPDDLVYPSLYAKQQEEATVRINFFPAMRQDIEPIRKLFNTYQHANLAMGGVKQFFDGVTSSHTALLKEEYAQPYFEGDVGISLLPLETMHDYVLEANKQGWPIRIHAIGDLAIQYTLSYIREAQMKFPLPKGYFNTVEHLEVMDLNDLDLVVQDQLILSVQPSHLLVGWETLDEEVGEKRASMMFPFETFCKAGAKLAFGTDTPVVIGITPLQSIYYAVARQTEEQLPKEVLMPEERMSIADSVLAHTLYAAKAISRSDIGSLQPGYRADFVVLDQNILDLDAQDLLTTKVLATFMDGKKVYTN